MKLAWRLRVLFQLLALFRPFLGWVILSTLAGVATVASGIGLMGASAYLIAFAAFQPSIAVLQVAIVGVRFFGLSRAVFRYLERLVSHSVNFRHLARLRVWFYSRIEPMAPAILQTTHSADLLSKAIADIETLENFYVRAIAPPLTALLVTAGTGWFVGLYHPHLALILAAALILSGVGLPILVYLLSRAPGSRIVTQRARLQEEMLDLIQGMPDLLAFGQGNARLANIQAVGRALGLAQRQLGMVGVLANALSLCLMGLALVGVLYIAIPLVGDRLDGIVLAVLALVALAAFEAVNPLTQAAQHLESSFQAARRLFELNGAESAKVSPSGQRPPPRTHALTIRGLTFSYSNDRPPALQDFHLDLPPGKRVGLVGASGAGKTTLVSLLLRFWEDWEGSIEMDGNDIRHYDVEDVRHVMSVVSHSSYLFSGTLRQNLLIAMPNAGQAELERAVQDARLSDLIERLPEGLDTWIGEHGSKLSGGERQRVMIARALLRDSPFLLLDEPVANLDAANERALIETLDQAGVGRSVIYITHRLVGLEKMDEILLLHEGKVIERGSHIQLLNEGGVYKNLWQIHKDVAVWQGNFSHPNSS